MVTIEWKKRRRHTTGAAAEYWILDSICGKWRVSESRSLFGYPTVFRAMRRDEIETPTGPRESWVILSAHRKLDPARAACELAARGEPAVVSGLKRRRKRKHATAAS